MLHRTDLPADSQGAPSTERLLTLSDGVVAIALTLLVLQLKVPVLQHSKAESSGALWRALTSTAQLGSFTAYVISFYVIAQFWLVHHRVFRPITGHSEQMAWWNFAFLFTVTVFPFSSALLGAYGNNPVAVIEFSLNLMLTSLSTAAISEVARRRGMFDPSTPRVVIRAGRARAVATVVAMVAAMAVAPFSPENAKFAWILLILTHRMANWWATGIRAPEDGTRPLPAPTAAGDAEPGLAGPKAGPGAPPDDQLPG